MASSDTLRCYHKMVPLVNSELSLIHFGTFLTSNTTQVQRADPVSEPISDDLDFSK